MSYDFAYLKPYFCGDMKHYYYKKCVDKHKCFEPHSDGCFPCELIECRRPNEPVEVQCYRKEIWVPKTKPTFNRILSSLGKIRRSPDWTIKYPDPLPRITEDESLKKYCDEEFPYFTSLTNWLFSVCLKKYLTDSNGVTFVLPLNIDTAGPTEYLMPYPIMFDSCDVIDFEDGELAILNIAEGTTYADDKGNMVAGKSYYVVDLEVIQRWDQIDSKGNYTMSVEYAHGLDELPVFKNKGTICESNGTNYLFESRIAGILPELDEAVREYSDLQAAKVLHIYPERWEYTQTECSECKGKGKRQNPNWFQGCDPSIPAHIPCDNKGCHNGFVAAGPFSKIMVRPTSAIEGGVTPPTPPAGYIEKDVDIVKLMEESVERHIYNALASINFQELAETPQAESGVAKTVDRDEQNNTVHSIAEDLISLMDNNERLIAKYRYKDLYSMEEIETMLPDIPVPEKFDLLSVNSLQEELKNAKDAKDNPVIISAMEVEFAAKKFNSNQDVHNVVALTLTLDPLPNITEDDKMSRMSNKGITQETYVISSNITEFVQRALDEDKNFPKQPLKVQKQKMAQYAKEVIDANSASTKIIQDVTQNQQQQQQAAQTQAPTPVA